MNKSPKQTKDPQHHVIAVTKSNCLMNGNWRVENVVFKCVASATKEHVYIGIAKSDWNQRY